MLLLLILSFDPLVVKFLIDCVDVPLVIDPVDNCVDEPMVAVSVTNSVIGPLVEFVIDRVVPLVMDSGG